MSATISIPTRAGKIAVVDRGTETPTLLLIHGNSGSKQTFEAQLTDFSVTNRVVALDLAGHGESEDSHRPSRDYTIPGHANYLNEVIDALGLSEVVVVGLSLGGFVALDLASKAAQVIGVFIVGTPPFARTAESLGAAFRPGPAIELSGKENFSEADVETYLHMHGLDSSIDPSSLRAAIRRCDGRSRSTFVGALLDSDAPDFRELAENSRVPIAVAVGENDTVVNADYFNTLHFRSFWRGRVHRIPESSHSPQLTNAVAFNELVRSFAQEVVEVNMVGDRPSELPPDMST
jgi:pimeloyl-ACP methyl ester carboxylesterase